MPGRRSVASSLWSAAARAEPYTHLDNDDQEFLVFYGGWDGGACKRQPRSMSCSRRRPAARLSAPGSLSAVRPSHPPSLATIRLASLKVSSEAGCDVFFLTARVSTSSSSGV